MKRLLRASKCSRGRAFFALAALVLAVRFWVLPDIERYRQDIVAAMSRGLGMPVRIGAIRAGWFGLRPQVALSDVRLYDAQGREALVLPSIDNVMAWRSLARGELVLHSVVIETRGFPCGATPPGDLYMAGQGSPARARRRLRRVGARARGHSIRGAEIEVARGAARRSAARLSAVRAQACGPQPLPWRLGLTRLPAEPRHPLRQGAPSCRESLEPGRA